MKWRQMKPLIGRCRKNAKRPETDTKAIRCYKTGSMSGGSGEIKLKATKSNMGATTLAPKELQLYNFWSLIMQPKFMMLLII
jgi:hypothetical protein